MVLYLNSLELCGGRGDLLNFACPACGYLVVVVRYDLLVGACAVYHRYTVNDARKLGELVNNVLREL